MQFHTQRLAKAAGLAARGQRDAFAAGAGQPRRVRALPRTILQKGGFAFDVDVPSAATTDELRSRLDELAQALARESADAATRDPRRAEATSWPCAQNIAQIRVGVRGDGRPCRRSSPASCRSRARSPAQVLRANRLTFLAERLGRGSAEILGSEMIDPEVPFLIGKDTNDLRELIKALESGSDTLGIAAVRDPETRAKLAELKQQFAAVRAERAARSCASCRSWCRRGRPARSSARRSEQLQSAVATHCRRRCRPRSPVRLARRDRRLRRAARRRAGPDGAGLPRRHAPAARPRRKPRTSATRRRFCGC